MKKILLASALALSVTSAFAADPSAVLKVKGTLTNAACSPELSGGGVVDYGTIHLGELSATETNQLGQKKINLTITCSSDTKVGFQVVDDRIATDAQITVENAYANGESADAGDYRTFGAGLTAENVKIGSWALAADPANIMVDGKAADFLSSPMWINEGLPAWKNNNPRARVEHALQVYTVAATGTLEPVAFKTATIPLVTSLAIQGTTTLAITDDTQIDGQATISLMYL